MLRALCVASGGKASHQRGFMGMRAEFCRRYAECSACPRSRPKKGIHFRKYLRQVRCLKLQGPFPTPQLAAPNSQLLNHQST